MSNEIVEKYFTQGDFSQRENEVLTQVIKETGFVVEKEIFRGKIYDKGKIGSLIYKGTLNAEPAVLKLQGLQPEVDEAHIIQSFNSQNQSTFVRLPKLYLHKKWSSDCEYGYLITEYIDAPKIFVMPFASDEQMQNFAQFYQEYRTQAIIIPWIQQKTHDTVAFVVKRVDNWRKISEHKKRLTLSDYAPYLMEFYPLAVRHFPTIPMVFSHGHLTAHDIYRKDGKYILLSNLFWSYRPQWYDIAFNIWSCLLHIRDTQYSIDSLVKYVEKWVAVYSAIPVVAQDQDFQRKITILLLERTIGSILTDIGANDTFAEQENKIYFIHLLALHQKFFEYLVKRLENI